MSDPVIGAAIATNGKFVLAIDIKESFDVAIKEVVVRYIIEEGGRPSYQNKSVEGNPIANPFGQSASAPSFLH